MCQPDSGEMALEVVDNLVRSGAVDIIVIDSVAALVPRSEIEGEIGAVQGAAHREGTESGRGEHRYLKRGISCTEPSRPAAQCARRMQNCG